MYYYFRIRYRVYNMRNLYVVDASILPSLPSGNINAAVIALAQKAAHIFKSEKAGEKRNIQRQHKSYNICYVFNICINSEICKYKNKTYS